MIVKVSVPNRFQFKAVPSFTAMLWQKKGEVHYIGGADILPPPLESKKEAEMISLLGTEGEKEARSLLIEHNLRLVVYIAKKFDNTAVGVEDLISIGTIGLIKGISSYKPDKGVRLATYAARCIENEILMYFRSQKKLQGEVSLSDSIDTDQDGNSLSFMDVISVDDTMLEDLSASETRGVLRCLVQTCLTPRERDIVEQRYGLDGKPPRTQREIAAACGISRSYVSRLEKKALEKLGREFERTQK